MKRSRPLRIAVAMTLVAIVSAGIGVNGAITPGEEPASDVSAAEEPVELTIWTIWGTVPDKRSWIEDVVAAYEQANSNVDITIEWFGDKADLYTQYNVVGQAGGANAPDILTADVRPLRHIPNQQAGWLLDLDEGLDRSHWDADLLGLSTYDDGTWTIPIEAFTFSLWYNASTLRDWGIEIPEDGRISWDLFMQIVEKASAEGLYTLAQGVQNAPHWAATYPMMYVLNALGPEYVTKVAVAEELPWNDAPLVEALQSAIDLIPSLYNPDVASINETEGRQLLFSNRAVFVPDGSWLPSEMARARDEGSVVDGMDLQPARFPTPPVGVGDGVVQWSAGSGWAASAFTKHPETVVDFFNFLSTPEWGAEWIERTAIPTGIVTSPDAEVEQLTATQLARVADGPSTSPAIYQIPFGDEEVYWKEGMTRFFADPGFTAQEFLDEMQRLRDSR
jgi:ABC-type glycerol-3-phosphate transport system substrate-binding protein